MIEGSSIFLFKQARQGIPKLLMLDIKVLWLGTSSEMVGLSWVSSFTF